jgi:hypothetical protein
MRMLHVRAMVLVMGMLVVLSAIAHAIPTVLAWDVTIHVMAMPPVLLVIALATYNQFVRFVT